MIKFEKVEMKTSVDGENALDPLSKVETSQKGVSHFANHSLYKNKKLRHFYSFLWS